MWRRAALARPSDRRYTSTTASRDPGVVWDGAAVAAVALVKTALPTFVRVHALQVLNREV